MKISGYCRFSYYGISDTGRAVSSPAEADRLLWNPTRMAVRMHLFEQIMLPSIAHQTDKDFTLHFITSEGMPEPYHERLEGLCAGLPFIRITRTDNTDLGSVIHPLVVEASLDRTEPSVHFRVDDDDGLCESYVARLRHDSTRVDPGGMITYSGGILGFLDGEVARHCVHAHPYIAIGLAIVVKPDAKMHPFRMQHARHADYVPSYQDPTFTAFHYTLHSTNNTSGYRQTLHVGGEQSRRVMRAIEKNAELRDGGVTTEAAEPKIAEAFPFTTGAAIRTAIEDAARPAELAERLNLPRP